MARGYMGKILKVDLSTKSISEVPIDEKIARKYLGGKGYGAYLLYQYLKELKLKGISGRDLDALGPENPMIIMTGPGTGIAGFPSPGRHHLMALKSPLTGSIASSNSGGTWGATLKFAGFDGIIVEGASDSPVYISIVDGKAEIRDAVDLWGKNAFDTTRILKKAVDRKRASVACIGPAGENLSLMAVIMNDDHRALGRAGVGAIMGSKMLKAIVVAGKEKVPYSKMDEFVPVSKRCLEAMESNAVTGEGLPAYGTAVLVNVINTAGSLPYNNWQTSVNPDAEAISGEALAEKYLTKKGACWGCSIACGRITSVKSGPYQILASEGPEYESIWALGSATGVKDLAAITKANHFCDEFGLDPISVGATIAAAMELNEKKYIPSEDLQGLDLKFGNAAAMVEAVWRIAHKTGFGKNMANGSRKLCEFYGHPEFSMSVKGLEMPAYDPRGIKGIGLNYATSNRGGCHVTGYTIATEIVGIPEKTDPLVTEGKAKWAKIFQDLASLVNSTVNCLFTTFAIGAGDYAELLAAVTGWDFTADELMRLGERVYNLERVIINDMGIDGKDDTLPARLLKEPLPEGPAKGQVADLDKMIGEYYKLRGWVDGVPTAAKLKELEIEL